MRGRSRTRQILSDAWESTISEDLLSNPWHRRIAETRLMKKFITDEEGTDLLLPRILVRKSLEVERGGFYIQFADIEAHGHIGSGPGCALVTSHGEEAKPRKDEFRERETSKLAKEDQRQQGKNNCFNEGRQNDQSKKLRKHQHLPIHASLWSILRVGRHQVGRGPYLCRSQVMLMTTYKFLRWMQSTRRMDEGVVTSEKCWSGIEVKMPEILRELN